MWPTSRRAAPGRSDWDLERPRVQAGQALLPAGSLLLLYTDGLIERRGEWLDAGLDRLA